MCSGLVAIISPNPFLSVFLVRSHRWQTRWLPRAADLSKYSVLLRGVTMRKPGGTRAEQHDPIEALRGFGGDPFLAPLPKRICLGPLVLPKDQWKVSWDPPRDLPWANLFSCPPLRPTQCQVLTFRLPDMLHVTRDPFNEDRDLHPQETSHAQETSTSRMDKTQHPRARCVGWVCSELVCV